MPLQIDSKINCYKYRKILMIIYHYRNYNNYHRYYNYHNYYFSQYTFGIFNIELKE